LPVLFADEGTTLYCGDVYAALRQQGTKIPSNDLWFAALAIEHNLVLDSRDAHFQQVPHLKPV